VTKISKVADVRVLGAGRTDTGVHATGQVAHFNAPEPLQMNAAAWYRAFNSNLPPEVRVLACAEVPETFNAQFDAKGKHYEYRICRLPQLPPLEHGLAWHVPWKMNRELLEQACQAFVGCHDFCAFAANRHDGRELTPGFSIRTITAIDITESADFLHLHFHGEGFLYKMVRLLTGSAFRVALGRESISWLHKLLHQPNGEKSQFVAPAGGLYLREVFY
jgi:tRNA pseudouridine38-40 synthase